MAKTISISPLTRIEGHLAIHTEAEPFTTAEGQERFRITAAHCEGEMFRGFEKILEGRDPLDAQQITQRICGVCPIAHGIASCKAQEMAYGIRPNRNGRLLRNLIFAANYLHSHIIHFYQLSALDFVDITAVLKYTGKDRALRNVKAWAEAALARSKNGTELYPIAPFLPRYEGDYVADTDTNCALIAHYLQALDIRRIAHEMAAVFGARVPHSTALVPGGVTQVPTEERVLTYRARLESIAAFIEDVYIPDVVTAAQAFPQYWDLGRGYGNMLAYGAFETDESGGTLTAGGTVVDGKWEALDVNAITEDVAYSRFQETGGARHPSQGETLADPRKGRAYSWVKAPRYRIQPMEVGPLARTIVDLKAPRPGPLAAEVGAVAKTLGVPAEKLYSVLGRHFCRAIESRVVYRAAMQWLDEIALNQSPAQDFNLPKEGAGYGLTEAERGALGHWITIENYKIRRYQCVVPTTWFCSPRDSAGKPGPVEKALEGVEVANAAQPLEAGRVVRSFDPCLACAIH